MRREIHQKPLHSTAAPSRLLITEQLMSNNTSCQLSPRKRESRLVFTGARCLLCVYMIHSIHKLLEFSHFCIENINFTQWKGRKVHCKGLWIMRSWCTYVTRPPSVQAVGASWSCRSRRRCYSHNNCLVYGFHIAVSLHTKHRKILAFRSRVTSRSHKRFFPPASLALSLPTRIYFSP